MRVFRRVANFDSAAAQSARQVRAKCSTQEARPYNGDAYEALALAQCWFDGDWEPARQTAIRGTQVSPQSALAWTAYAHTHDVCGLHDDAVRGAARFLEQQCDLGRAAWSDVALIHLGSGSPDAALAFLQRAARQKPFGGLMTAYLAVHPLFDPLRREPGFVDVLRALGLDSYAWTDRSWAPSEHA